MEVSFKSSSLEKPEAEPEAEEGMRFYKSLQVQFHAVCTLCIIMVSYIFFFQNSVFGLAYFKLKATYNQKLNIF